MADLNETRKDMEKTLSFFEEELRKIRAGRAHPDMVRHIKVNVAAYKSTMPLEQLANINAVDATLLTIQPWDRNVINDVVKALSASDLSITPIIEGNLIKLPLPQLTTERREEYIKIMRQKAEEARIAIRQKRKSYLLDLEKYKEEGMSEDDFKRYEKELQELVNEMNKKIEEVAKKKEEELKKI